MTDLTDNRRYIEELKEKVRIGALFDSFLNGEFFPVFKKYVITDFRNSALDTFTEVNPDEISEVVQAQLLGKIPDKIVTRMQELADDGKMALNQLKEILNN